MKMIKIRIPVNLEVKTRKGISTVKFTKDLYVAATATWIPGSTVSLADAIERGIVGDDHKDLGYETISVAENQSGAEMAVRAGRVAIERAGIDLADYGLVMHATGGFVGLDMWPAAAYVANETIGSRAVGYDVQQRCNGALGALALAASFITTGYTSAAMITTGDNFASPWVDRWSCQANFIYGDGGTALVLSDKTGFARLVSATVGAENSLEPFSRGDAPFALSPGLEVPVRMLERGGQYGVKPEAEGGWGRYEAALRRTVEQALDDAGANVEDIAWVTGPYIHRNQFPENYELLGFKEEQSTWDLGRTIGHLGPGDPTAGINHFVENRSLSPGDLVLVFAAGAGFTLSAAVLEILNPPSW